MRNIKLLWFLLLVAIMMFVMKVQWNLANKTAMKGIVALEFAKTSEEAKEITKDWYIPGAIANTYLDSLFIIAYTLFLFAAVYRSGDQLKGPAQYLKYFAWLGPVAGLLDFIENYFLLQFLNDSSNFQSTYTISALKFGLAGFLFVLFLIFACSVIEGNKKKLY